MTRKCDNGLLYFFCFMNFPRIESVLTPVLAALSLSCATGREINGDTTCTDPKLVQMSDEVANAIDMALLDMEIISGAPHTQVQHGDFQGIQAGSVILFKNRAMLVNDGNAMTNGNATLCDKKDDGEIDCYVGQAKNFKSNPVVLDDLRTVTLKGDTVSVSTSSPDDPTRLVTKWIVTEPENGVCGVNSRYGESSKWCADVFTGKQPPGDIAREGVCIKDFNLSKDRIIKQEGMYEKRLAK